MKEEFTKGFAQGYQATSGYNFGAQPTIPVPVSPTPAFSAFQPTAAPAFSFAQAFAAPVQQLSVNGKSLSEIDKLKLKIAGYQPPAGAYW